MKKEFKLNEKQLKKLLDAMKPTPVMKIGSYVSGLDRQERANNAWEELGEELGFDYMTVKPASGKGMEYFTAETKE